MNNADLHNHTYYSDGLISPKELVKLARRKRVKYLALTDHNSVKGIREAIAEGNRLGVEVIPGIELRADKGEVLGYFIDIKNKGLLNKTKMINKRVQDKTKDFCRKLHNAGFKVTFKEIWNKYPRARGNFGTFYPLFILNRKGYGKMLELSRIIHDKDVSFPVIKEISMIEAIKIIRKAGGAPVLAHPWLDEDALESKTFRAMAKVGLKGIEVNNGDRFPFKRRGIDRKIRQLAKRYGLILTSGSDFHGLEASKEMPGRHYLGENSCSNKVVEALRKAASQ